MRVWSRPWLGGPPRSVRHTKTLVLERVYAGSQPLPDGYEKGQGGLPDPLSEGGATPLGLTLATNVDPDKANNNIP